MSRNPLDHVPGEPALRMRNIQGIAVPGFFKPAQMLIHVWHRGDEVTLAKVKTFLRDFEPTNGTQALADRRTFRHVARRRNGARHDPREKKLDDRAPLLAIAFTYHGLCMLSRQASRLRDGAFKQGLSARAALLGDPVCPGHGVPGCSASQGTRCAGHDGRPCQWVVGAPGDEPAFVIVVAGDESAVVRTKARELTRQVREFSCKVRRDIGNRVLDPGDCPATAKGREHFGFVDGIAQPGIRGRASRHDYNPITRRHVTGLPESALQGLPGQDLVWPGEFVLGYPASGPDPRLAGPIRRPELSWMQNGSYLVFRRLSQDVRTFWEVMQRQSALLRLKPGFELITPESLAEQLMGRRRDGVPLSRLPGLGDVRCPILATDALANNDFRFDSDTPRPNVRADDSGRRLALPRAQADPLGMACPFASHIRRVNPRDSATDIGGASDTLSHRILRTSITYGPRSADPLSEPAGRDRRGVLFMCIQSSIEDQFEFLQARWMNDPRRPRATSGHDMIAGRNISGPGASRTCTIFGEGGAQATVEIDRYAVTPTGGGYYFIPSLRALWRVLARPHASRAEKDPAAKT